MYPTGAHTTTHNCNTTTTIVQAQIRIPPEWNDLRSTLTTETSNRLVRATGGVLILTLCKRTYFVLVYLRPPRGLVFVRGPSQGPGQRSIVDM